MVAGVNGLENFERSISCEKCFIIRSVNQMQTLQLVPVVYILCTSLCTSDLI